MHRRRVLAIGSALFVGGCLGGSGDYDDDAGAYLVTASDIGEEWETDRTYDPLYSANTDSQRAADFVRDGNVLTVALGVFPTIADATDFLADRRSSYEDSDLSVSEVDIGDTAIETSDGTIATVDARRSNVFFEAYGDVDMPVARRVARIQDEQLQDYTPPPGLTPS